MQSYFAAFYHASWGALEAKIMKNLRKLAEVYGETDLTNISISFGSMAEPSREQYEWMKKAYYKYASQKKWELREEFIWRISLTKSVGKYTTTAEEVTNVNWLTGDGIVDFKALMDELPKSQDVTGNVDKIGNFVDLIKNQIEETQGRCKTEWNLIELKNFNDMLERFESSRTGERRFSRATQLSPMVKLYAVELGVSASVTK